MHRFPVSAACVSIALALAGCSYHRLPGPVVPGDLAELSFARTGEDASNRPDVRGAVVARSVDSLVLLVAPGDTLRSAASDIASVRVRRGRRGPGVVPKYMLGWTLGAAAPGVVTTAVLSQQDAGSMIIVTASAAVYGAMGGAVIGTVWGVLAAVAPKWYEVERPFAPPAAPSP